MRTSSNPVFRNLPGNSGGASVGRTATRPQPSSWDPQGGQTPAQPYTDGRAMTIDDVVTKTAMTLGVLVVTAVAAYVIGSANPGLVLPMAFGGMLIGLGLVLLATLGGKMSKTVVLAYAAFEGVFVGAISLLLAGSFGGGNLVTQAVIGTIGVFGGMLVVYRTGAIRVTPKLTKMVIGALFGVLALVVINLVASFFTDGGLGLRSGGPLAILFSLVCIGLGAFLFLLDFDQADKLIRAGAPAEAAWGVALGLTVTLVWVYIEILRLLSYFNRN